MIKLSDSQLYVLSEICRDIAQVAFAIMVITPMINGFKGINWYVIIAGVIITFLFWFLSVLVVKGTKR